LTPEENSIPYLKNKTKKGWGCDSCGRHLASAKPSVHTPIIPQKGRKGWRKGGRKGGREGGKGN
jgi:hypothetical protein